MYNCKISSVVCNESMIFAIWYDTQIIFYMGPSNVSYTYRLNRVGWGKMSMLGQSRSLEIFICMPKIRKPMVIRSTRLFSHWNRKSKTDYPVIVSPLAFNSETKVSSDSLCPTILILPHHTLSKLLRGILGKTHK